VELAHLAELELRLAVTPVPLLIVLQSTDSKVPVAQLAPLSAKAVLRIPTETSLVPHARLTMLPKLPKMSPVMPVVLPTARHVPAPQMERSHATLAQLDMQRNLQQSVFSAQALATVALTVAAKSSVQLVRITLTRLHPMQQTANANSAQQTTHHALHANSLEPPSTAKHAISPLISTQLLRHASLMPMPVENVKPPPLMVVPAQLALMAMDLRTTNLADNAQIPPTAKVATEPISPDARTAMMDMFMMIIISVAPANLAAQLGALALLLVFPTVKLVLTPQLPLFNATLVTLDTF